MPPFCLASSPSSEVDGTPVPIPLFWRTDLATSARTYGSPFLIHPPPRSVPVFGDQSVCLTNTQPLSPHPSLSYMVDKIRTSVVHPPPVPFLEKTQSTFPQQAHAFQVVPKPNGQEFYPLTGFSWNQEALSDRAPMLTHFPSRTIPETPTAPQYPDSARAFYCLESDSLVPVGCPGKYLI